MSTLGSLFLNTGQGENTVVQAPAFSITKVMAVAAPLVTALVTWLTSTLNDGFHFTSGEVTALIASLIGFLALTGAADVIARGLATSAEKTAAGRGRWIRFDQPLAARLTKSGLGKAGRDEKVSVLAASDAQPPEFLCVREDKSLSWEPAAMVTFG